MLARRLLGRPPPEKGISAALSLTYSRAKAGLGPSRAESRGKSSRVASPAAAFPARLAPGHLAHAAQVRLPGQPGAQFLSTLEFLLKSGDMEFTLGNAEPLQLSMRQCPAALVTGSAALPAGAAEPEGRGRRAGGVPGEAAARACAPSPSDPRLSMGFPICGGDSPERAAAAAGFARRDSGGI